MNSIDGSDSSTKTSEDDVGDDDFEDYDNYKNVLAAGGFPDEFSGMDIKFSNHQLDLNGKVHLDNLDETNIEGTTFMRVLEQQQGGEFLARVGELRFDEEDEEDSLSSSKGASVATYKQPEKKRKISPRPYFMKELPYPDIHKVPKCLRKKLRVFMRQKLEEKFGNKCTSFLSTPRALPFILQSFQQFFVSMFMAYHGSKQPDYDSTAKHVAEKSTERVLTSDDIKRLEKDGAFMALFKSPDTLMTLNFRKVMQWWLDRNEYKLEINGRKGYSADELDSIEKGMYQNYDWTLPWVESGSLYVPADYTFRFNWNNIFKYAEKGLAPNRKKENVQEKITKQSVKWNLGLSWHYVLSFFRHHHHFHMKMRQFFTFMENEQNTLNELAEELKEYEDTAKTLTEEIAQMETAQNEEKNSEIKKKKACLHKTTKRIKETKVEMQKRCKETYFTGGQ